MNYKIPNSSKSLIITSAAKHGIMESVFNVLIITILMQTVFVAKSNPNVELSTEQLEFVKPATKGTEFQTANVSESI